MKQISKGREPRSFENHRANGGEYQNLPTIVKDELREQLLYEQGNICCYCMKRIPQTLNPDEIRKNYPSSKIAHIESQDNHPEKQLNYNNLSVACNGNFGQPEKVQTCDTFQKSKDFHFSPAGRRNIEDIIKYNGLGEIYSDNEQLNKELVDVLNLNTYDLKRIRSERYKFYKRLIEHEGKNRQGKEIQRRFFETEKQRLITKQCGKFDEYCMVGVYLLDKKLNKIK